MMTEVKRTLATIISIDDDFSLWWVLTLIEFAKDPFASLTTIHDQQGSKRHHIPNANWKLLFHFWILTMTIRLVDSLMTTG